VQEEGRRQKAEGRKQKAEGGKRKAESRKQNSEGAVYLLEELVCGASLCL
jgi:hypothetical protein